MCDFTFHSFSYPKSTAVHKQMNLPLTCHQKLSSSLTLCPNACILHLAPSHHRRILSSDIITTRVSTVQDTLRERERQYSHKLCNIICITVLFDY